MTATITGTVYSANFEPEDDDGNPLDGMLLTIRVPKSTQITAGRVVVRYEDAVLSDLQEDSSTASKAEGAR